MGSGSLKICWRGAHCRHPVHAGRHSSVCPVRHLERTVADDGELADGLQARRQTDDEESRNSQSSENKAHCDRHRLGSFGGCLTSSLTTVGSQVRFNIWRWRPVNVGALLEEFL